VRVTATVAYGARALTGAPDLSGLGLILTPVRPEEQGVFRSLDSLPVTFVRPAHPLAGTPPGSSST